jgi:hypothetical protein
VLDAQCMTSAGSPLSKRLHRETDPCDKTSG